MDYCMQVEVDCVSIRTSASYKVVMDLCSQDVDVNLHAVDSLFTLHVRAWHLTLALEKRKKSKHCCSHFSPRRVYCAHGGQWHESRVL